MLEIEFQRDLITDKLNRGSNEKGRMYSRKLQVLALNFHVNCARSVLLHIVAYNMATNLASVTACQRSTFNVQHPNC
jgi:hypothetical protein